MNGNINGINQVKEKIIFSLQSHSNSTFTHCFSFTEKYVKDALFTFHVKRAKTIDVQYDSFDIYDFGLRSYYATDLNKSELEELSQKEEEILKNVYLIFIDCYIDYYTNNTTTVSPNEEREFVSTNLETDFKKNQSYNVLFDTFSDQVSLY